MRVVHKSVSTALFSHTGGRDKYFYIKGGGDLIEFALNLPTRIELGKTC